MKRMATIAVVIFSVGGASYGIAAAASTDTPATNVACATATAATPNHTVGVDGTDVHTISGASTTASHCETQTYIIPAATTETSTATTTDTQTVTQTVTTTPAPTSTSSTSSSTSTTTTGPAPAPAPVALAAAPTGPATPSSGWKTVLADGFNNQYPLSPLWGPNANDNNGAGLTAAITSPAPTEVEAYEARQVSLQADGLHLTAQYDPGAGGAGHDYRSGIVDSQQLIPGEPGQQGWPGITGFRWLPTAGVTTVFEANMAAPDTSGGGEDPGFWLSTSAWVDEIDMPEMWNYGTKPWGLGMTWIYNTSAGSMIQKYAWGLPAQTDQQFHKWTIQFDGTARTERVWIDGVEHPELSYSWPASFSSVPMYLVLSHGLRNAYGDHPTWTSGSTVYRFRSVAVYQDAAHAGVGVTGGGIMPGTVVK